ncbi:MAG: Npt1/Npt2 family nucleotide transporter [Cyanobacteria bacterium P01_H01_bin.121]
MTTALPLPTALVGVSQNRFLQWLNLRPEEVERTTLMFTFSTAFSVGWTWLEASTVALFLEHYGAAYLPLVYIATAFMGSGVGALYSLLQRVLSLRQVIVLVPLLLTVPLLILRLGLGFPNSVVLGLPLFGVTVFLLRLWAEATFILADINTSIMANQLFNIREIKRTYPLISSGLLVADVVSGFALPVLLLLLGENQTGLYNVVVIGAVVMLLATGVLYYLTQRYERAFPDIRRQQQNAPKFEQELTKRRIQGPLKKYSMALVIFFVVAQLVLMLVEFQFFDQLETRFGGTQIANFIGIFNGVLGLCEISTQWFLSSRVIERYGVFIAIAVLPVLIVLTSGLTLVGMLGLLFGAVALKFFDELLRYTLLSSTGAVLFQPIPEQMRSQVQTIRGISDSISMGLMGVVLLATIAILERFNWLVWQNQVFLLQTVLLGGVWLFAVFAVRNGYVEMLVLSAERGQLSGTNYNPLALRQAVIGALEKNSPEAEKSSCIELLSQLYPEEVPVVLAPLLRDFSPELKLKSLQIMLQEPQQVYIQDVQHILRQQVPPEVLALALRYIWLADSDPDLNKLKPYLQPEIDAIVRGTAAALMMRRGNPRQKAEATQTLRRMLTHRLERERVMGCRALGDADYLQALRIYIPKLLRDDSLRVRCQILQAIAATHLEEYYPSLILGLHYPSTREAASQALINLESEAVPRLIELATDRYKSETIRYHAWLTLSKINSPKAILELVYSLQPSLGATRRNLLQILLKLPHDRGIDAVLDHLDGRRGIEQLITQEMYIVGQLHVILAEFSPKRVTGWEADLLRRAFEEQQQDAQERIFLLMRFLYPAEAIQAAAFCLESTSSKHVARGIEILDNTIDLPRKRQLLALVDQRPSYEKIDALGDLLDRTVLSPQNRIRFLLDWQLPDKLQPDTQITTDLWGSEQGPVVTQQSIAERQLILDDWPLACCFHLARAQTWSLTPQQTLACLQHPTGFVREAVISYLSVVSPRALAQLLPLMVGDSSELVEAQVRQLCQELRSLNPSLATLAPDSQQGGEASSNNSPQSLPNYGSMGHG